MFDCKLKQGCPVSAMAHLFLQEIGSREIFSAELAEFLVMSLGISHFPQSSEANNAFDMVPPVAGLFLRFSQSREACLVAGPEGVDLVALLGAVEVDLTVLMVEVDGDGVRVATVSYHREEAPVGIVEYVHAFLVGKLLLSAAHRPELVVWIIHRTSVNSPVTESIIKPRTVTSEGIRGWFTIVPTVLRTDFSVSWKPSSHSSRSTS